MLGAGPRPRRAGKVESLFICPADEQMILFISSLVSICLISHAVAKCADILLCFFSIFLFFFSYVLGLRHSCDITLDVSCLMVASLPTVYLGESRSSHIRKKAHELSHAMIHQLFDLGCE